MVNRALARLGRPAAAFLSSLGRNTAGNVLALVAATLPPILILVGGGVDMSRAYMAQTSLQNACDSGVLAGRRAQAKSGAWGSAEQAKAARMFNINYQGTSAGATSTTFTATNPSVGVISATATSTVPTTIMKLFGTNAFTLTATCSAEFQVSNIDVMMVLDTTGSMACRTNGTNCDSGSSSKIEGLKSAVRSFYYTIAAAVPSGGATRVRFGFVPYSGTVNVKNLVTGTTPAIPTSYFTASTRYQTKLANFTTPVYTGTQGSPTVTYETATYSRQSRCENWASADPVTTGTPPADTTTDSYAFHSYNSSTDACVRKVTTTPTTNYVLNGYKLTNYTYTQDAVDTSGFRAMAAVPVVTAISATATVPTSGSYDMVELAAMSGTTGLTTTSYTWTGCIEERDTVNSAFSNNNAPTAAYDHNLVSSPSDDATRWRPYIGALVFDRGQANSRTTSTLYASATEYCVPPAQNFTAVDTTNKTTVPAWIETYLGTLYAYGNTYHDIGMLWGGRLAAVNGINSATVTAGNLSAVSRHIIFLTDGELAPNNDVYNAYGLEYIDNRVAPSGNSENQLKSYHNNRFTTACQSAKNLGYTIWVIGFGQSLTTEMTACASGGRAYYANDTATLQTTFRTIASQVADLRLRS